MTREENHVEHLLQVGEGLAGLSLEQLGFEPRLEDLTAEQRSVLGPDDFEWMESITQERRAEACSRRSFWRVRFGRRRSS